MLTQRTFVVLSLGLLAGFGATFASTLEDDYRQRVGWIPGIRAGEGPPETRLPGTLQQQHFKWHNNQTQYPADTIQGREFVEFHRELLAQSDDFRIYGMDTDLDDPDAVVIPVLFLPGSTVKFGHDDGCCPRPPLHLIQHGAHGPKTCTGSTLPDECHADATWTPRPVYLQMVDLDPLVSPEDLYTYTANALGMKFLQQVHKEAHGTLGRHQPSDAGNTNGGVKDGAFWQLHKNLDNIYSDWAVGKYRLADNSGRPIFFSVAPGAVGAAGSALRERNGSDVYQGNTPTGNPPRDPLTQYGARPRIPSDIYVGNSNFTNLLYAAGVRKWKPADDPSPNQAWDIDALSVLNPPGNGWYFSTRTALFGGIIYQSSGTGTRTVFRNFTELGLDVHDNLDALEIDQQKRVQGTNDFIPRKPAIYDRPGQWFSLRVGSTYGVQAKGGVLVDASDILRFDENGDLVIDVSHTALGLVADPLDLLADDDLDALAIVDVDNSDTLDPGDLVYYSLATGSPALAGRSGADVLCYTVGVGLCPEVAVTAAQLGLFPADDLDALDLRRGGGTGGAPPASGASVLAPETLTGACCQSGGTCADSISQSTCEGAGGTFAGPGTTCATTQCPAAPGSGACCRSGGTCSILQPSSCLAVGGTFAGEDSVCEAAQCPSAPGACCASNGSCTQVSDRACLLAGGTFRGVGVGCTSGLCPAAPANDECTTASVIPYNFVSGYQPPADNTNATSPPYFQPTDPPYSCEDHRVFGGPYGSGTIWYSYTVPNGPGPGRSVYITTDQAARFYPAGGGAGDTKLALYYAPNGDCSVLQEVACADNLSCAIFSNSNSNAPPYNDPTGQDCSSSSAPLYAPLRYNNPAPGRYYLQVSTTFNADRGRTYLTISDPPVAPAPTPTPPPVPARMPTMSSLGLAVLTLVLVGCGAIWLRLLGRDAG